MSKWSKFRTFVNASANTLKLNEVNLIGRDFVHPMNLSNTEIKSLLWTAMDLKHLSKQRCPFTSGAENAKIAMILDKATVFSQFPLNNSVHLLNARLNSFIDDKWHEFSNVEDLGQSVALSSDLIFCKGDQEAIEAIADAAHIPVIAISSPAYDIVKILSDLMTIQEHYCFLKSLKFSWIGEPGPLIHTYLNMLPRLGMDIKFYYGSNSCDNPCYIETAMRYSQENNTEIHECLSVQDAIYRSDIIATIGHDDEDLSIRMKDVKEAAINWVLLHGLPRGCHDVELDVFRHKNCLVWASLSNTKWIFTAIIIRFLCGHEHFTEEPQFDNFELGYKK